ncbi:MAG: ABC transporter permease [Lachnospiraceae bacterium]|nr:ABC transporter permease [Lachnospiraceae bacterium]
MSDITIIDSEEKPFGLLDIPRALFKNRRLLYSLGKNDFKQKFAGSYLGVIWAFVQPIITVLVYWFVFQMALNVGTQATKAGIDAPYVLWLLGGLVPWFFFNDALVNGAGALLSYEYLVKKVVFEVSILPVVKIFSSLFVHIFFVVFTLLMYSLYGFFPTVYTVQIVYYFLAMFFLVLGLVYFCSAITVLFRDMTQLISIGLSVLIWMTPIMWNLNGMLASGHVPRALLLLLEANPMFYIVQGYRDALLDHQWFWEHPGLTAYFWIVSFLCFVVGTRVFTKLTPSFADVL